MAEVFILCNHMKFRQHRCDYFLLVGGVEVARYLQELREIMQKSDFLLVAAGIRLAGATSDVHILDVRTGKWEKMDPAGEPPSPRAAHAAAAVGSMVVVQVGSQHLILLLKVRIKSKIRKPIARVASPEDDLAPIQLMSKALEGLARKGYLNDGGAWMPSFGNRQATSRPGVQIMFYVVAVVRKSACAVCFEWRRASS